MNPTETPLTWIDAAKILTENPLASVFCPSKQDGKLVVFDVEHEDRVSRYLVCPNCQSHNVILLKVSPNLHRAKLTLTSSDEKQHSLAEIVRIASQD
jgi:hypothetical protein